MAHNFIQHPDFKTQNINTPSLFLTSSLALLPPGLDPQKAMNIILRPQRDLDIKGASLLQQKVFSLFPAPPHSNWAIDLVQVQNIDHFGLTTLVTIRQAAQHYQCNLYLFNLKPSVRYMLAITELESQFKVVDNLETLFTDGLRIVLC
ncbi:MAG: STAS domain-containing protein [Jaaginema sp. PMC 1079.18]|nr:STAS domain-containing protein [Jaaginema sp. PMC 1080.18]MEC4849705.1 STAS domain-containing protein [Jaaginema sp. PMC 1079.18]MEC4864866.1 STAS domain-containing protein [Jaaginema sp. PMC 1078.18]